MNHFFAYLSRMRFINRWALMRNSYTENIAEHSAQVAQIAHALALIKNRMFGGNLNVDRIATAALYHETSEVLTGDLPTPIKYYNPEIRSSYKSIEKIANQKLISMLPEELRADYLELIELDESSYEHMLVKAADKISAYIKCVEEQKAGNTEFESAALQTMASMKDMGRPELDWFIEECLPAFSLNIDQL